MVTNDFQSVLWGRFKQTPQLHFSLTPQELTSSNLWYHVAPPRTGQSDLSSLVHSGSTMHIIKYLVCRLREIVTWLSVGFMFFGYHIFTAKKYRKKKKKKREREREREEKEAELFQGTRLWLKCWLTAIIRSCVPYLFPLCFIPRLD